jgi:hypothetical protein
MASMPCFLHLFFLQSHSSFPAHYFSVLKVAVPLALGPFALIPLSAWALTGRPAGKHAQMACAAVLLALALGYIALEWLRVLPQFAREQEESVPIAAARFVGAHTGYADVVITANPELKLTYPSPYIGLSMKQVELALGLQRAYDFVAAVQDEYVINILFAEKDSASSPGLDELRQKAFEQIREGGFCMDRVRKADFLAACRAAHVSEPPPRVPLRKLNWPAQQDLIRRMGELIVDIDIPQK